MKKSELSYVSSCGPCQLSSYVDTQKRPGDPGPCGTIGLMGPCAPVCLVRMRNLMALLSGPFVGPWAIWAHCSVPRPFWPIVGPWAVRAHCLSLGRLGPLFGPWAFLAHFLYRALGRSGPGHVGMSRTQRRWACPILRGGGHVTVPREVGM